MLGFGMDENFLSRWDVNVCRDNPHYPHSINFLLAGAYHRYLHDLVCVRSHIGGPTCDNSLYQDTRLSTISYILFLPSGRLTCHMSGLDPVTVAD